MRRAFNVIKLPHVSSVSKGMEAFIIIILLPPVKSYMLNKALL